MTFDAESDQALLMRAIVESATVAPDLSGRIKHPALRALLGVWERERHQAVALPSVSSLQLDRAEIRNNTFVFQLVDLETVTLRQRFLGAALAAHLPDRSDTEIRLGNEEDPLLGMRSTYRRCLRLRAPIHEYLRMTTDPGGTKTMERLLLPCQDLSDSSHYLVGMVVFEDETTSKYDALVLDGLSPSEINTLPFGVIKLDQAGRVEMYSQSESRFSGYGDRAAVGLDFFTSIAPCMNSSQVRGRIEAGMHAGRFDAEFTHVGDFIDRDRELYIRAVSARGGGVWMLIRRA